MNAKRKKRKLTQEDWATYRRLLTYTKPYKVRLILGVIFGMLFGGSTGGILMAIKENVQEMFDPTHMPLAQVLGIAALLPLFAGLRGIGDYFSRYFVQWVGNRVVLDLRRDTFAHIHDLSVLYFTRSRTGELISRTTNDTMMVQRAVSTVIGDLVRQPFVLIAAVTAMMMLDPKLAAYGLVLFPVCIIPVALYGRRVRKSSREGQEKLADLLSILQESIMGVRIVKAFGMADYEKERFNNQNRAVFRRLMNVVRAKAAVEPIIVTISAVGLSLVLMYVRWTKMPADIFFTYAAALVMLYEPVKKLSRIHLNIQQSCAGADRIFEILDTEIRVKEATDPVLLGNRVSEVEFRDVDFAYDDEPVLQNISFSVREGECVAFVGSSGAGKSTLVGLLPRFYDVSQGAVLMNGRDVRDYSLKSLREQIGLVSQETVLFNDTVANNIAYGQQQASRDAIEEAARKAHAHDFIMQLPEGYDTIIGERGLRLSGGQCQRLAIARAMLRNPPILILDEATSALDTESERQVQAALDELMAHRTVFAIAHRLSTIAHADRIIVLEKGEIAEQGSHEELLALNGLYKYLYDLQFDVS
jgi:subfamily B ATP-binding cassette protein MsbA